MIRGRAAASEEIAAREEAASLKILLWTFALAAIAMCATVVVTEARSWTEFWWISGFVVVFALLKIALANALFYLMVHCDSDARIATAKGAAPLKPLPGSARGTFGWASPPRFAASAAPAPSRRSLHISDKSNPQPRASR
jgi:hypothetical protein